MHKPRDESPGFHHVVTRGNNKRRIFLDDEDREVFSRLVAHVAVRYGWTIIAYCLMDNHYHLVIRVGDKGLSGGMCELNTGYAIGFNKRHKRINHLFGRRFWNERAPSTGSLLNVVRYVVQNPVRAGGRRQLEAYAWTSYAATIGSAVARMRLVRYEVLAFFGESPELAVARFREFCAVFPPSAVRRRPP